MVLPTGPCSVGLLAGICCTKSQFSPHYSLGLGAVVTNEWCISTSLGSTIIHDLSQLSDMSRVMRKPVFAYAKTKAQIVCAEIHS